MVYTTIDEVNITGLDDILVYIGNAVPLFIPIMLIFIWLMVTLMVYFGSRKFAGQGDIFASMSSAGLMVVILGSIMTFTSGVINIWTLSITILIAIVSVILFMAKRNRD